MTARGKLITFEGIDGAGKSTHLDFVCEQVRARGFDVVKSFEPGGTPFGRKIREVVLGEHASPLAEALAMFAARSAHVDELIEPALEAGRWVVCVRFSDSTYAYQCGGRGLPATAVSALEELVHPGLQPDLTFLFDIDPATASARQRARGGAQDEFERRDLDFFARVRNAYLERMRAHPQRIHLVDASADVARVREQLLLRLTQLLA